MISHAISTSRWCERMSIWGAFNSGWSGFFDQLRYFLSQKRFITLTEPDMDLPNEPVTPNEVARGHARYGKSAS